MTINRRAEPISAAMNVQKNPEIWMFIAALIGSALLLIIINLITGGRGIGGRQRN